VAEPAVGPRPPPEPSLVVVGAIAGDAALGREAAAAFAEPWGGVALWGEAAPFDPTGYYAPELGADLTRAFGAAGLAPADALPELKARAWAVERDYARAGRRRVNLDPGLLDATKLVLASFKPGPQKLYLGDGVWADVVLYLDHGRLGPLPWTFADLREGPHVTWAGRARERLKALRRERRRRAGGEAAP